eukprot:CAMPEP_0113623894 /NCGR_PEP_ID=MMETSP0017_2-20120614/12310_1 /TAXON_ID=2856 /ORGANISM="Cylindrotheca closterium" /LENGTH=852 /DNA_ID=CAMNT_0000533893 /DNA_START=95 /DNA_END=2656 /DNA_ORIENTATION=- /assembly_acc=CAM_ASM_000147
MADIATTPQPQATSSVPVSSSNDMIQSATVTASSETSDPPADEATGESSTPEKESSEKTEPKSVPPPKPAFAWGKPTTNNAVAKDAFDTTNNNTTTITAPKAKSLLSIMQEEQEISKVEQAQKEEDDFMKQAIQQSLALQQQEEDDLAMALRLSQMDAGVDMTDMTTMMMTDGNNEKKPPVSDESSSNLKQAPVSDESSSSNLNLKQAPVSETAPEPAAAASLPETLNTSTATASASAASTTAAAASMPPAAEASGGAGLSNEELASIQLAIQQAEDEDMQKSLQLAMQLEMENQSMLKLQQQQQQQQQVAKQQRQQNQGNVRVISREEYLLEQKGLLLKKDHGEDEDYYYRQQHEASAGGGFRINAQHASSNPNWTRLDGFVVGPNDEIRTKHDPELQGQANAHRLHLDQQLDGNDDYYYDDQYEAATNGGSNKKMTRVGNKAYNSFQQTMKKKTVKGVASHGQGRANTDTEKTKEGALDSRVRLLIGKTINQDWIDEFHGCIKEGKEALVYHATSGKTADDEMGVGQMADTTIIAGGGGDTPKVGDYFENKNKNGKYDVAVKVFKRIQEFRNRGQYVQGDPRYHSQEFSHSSGRVQLELWAEKEYRNLIRAYRVGIPVPQPLLQRENVVFLRFLGQDGWPCPQLREVKMKRKSHKWMALYQQTMEAIQTLYQEARLVHGDLSEYNLLVCPSYLLLRKKVAPETSVEQAKKDDKEESDGKIIDSPAKEEEEEVKEVEEEEVADQKMSASASKPSPASAASADTADTTADNNKQAVVSFAKQQEDYYDPNALQIALIDFGQAVDTRHPQATELLERDLLRVKQFFAKMGITTTLSAEAAMKYVTTKGAPLLI